MTLVAGLGGCGFLPRVANDTLHVLNDTSMPVTLVVNDRVITVVEPMTSANLDAADVGALPLDARVTTASGRELLRLVVEAGSVRDEPNLDGSGSYSAPAARVDLSCGQIRLFAGRIMPGGPAPGPGTPGDCAP
jgi:hypothetical protein